MSVKDDRKRFVEEDKLISTEEFAKLLGVTVHQLYRMKENIKEEKLGFPKSFRLGGRIVRWKLREVLEYKRNRTVSEEKSEIDYSKIYVSRAEVLKQLNVSAYYFRTHLEDREDCPDGVLFKKTIYYPPKEIRKFIRNIKKEVEEGKTKIKEVKKPEVKLNFVPIPEGISEFAKSLLRTL